MNNYKLIIQYDGTNFAGWQIQSNADTIQQRISDSIKTILKEEVNLIGSGRTDAGVHALGQVANFRTEQEIDLYRFKHSLNSILPFDISVLRIEKTDVNFHSRYDAKKRSYVYLFSKFKSPFYNRYSYFYHNDINCERLNLLSNIFIGQNDFSSFSRKNSDTENKVCNIYSAGWKETKGLIIFVIEADRFLHGMVRTIIGTLLTALKNNTGEKYIEDVILKKDREAAGEAVPAKGLFLFKVKY
ncbi:MAG: tRNA pseudouridine(38-40) synthase TruA [Ignavibacteriaceae bacterium]